MHFLAVGLPLSMNANQNVARAERAAPLPATTPPLSVVWQNRNQGKIMPTPTTQGLITQLKLVRHPEGGWFRETYRSTESVPAQALPERFDGSRALSTAIYFLLEEGDISALHRIRSDEMWHFYAGAPLLIHAIYPAGRYEAQRLGPDHSAGDLYQVVVPAGCWFGAELAGKPFALVGCTVSPGFDFADFEMADRLQVTENYPQHAELIRRLTKVP